MGSQSEADSESNMSGFRESLLNGSGDYSPLRSADNSPLRFVSSFYVDALFQTSYDFNVILSLVCTVQECYGKET